MLGEVLNSKKLIGGSQGRKRRILHRIATPRQWFQPRTRYKLESLRPNTKTDTSVMSITSLLTRGNEEACSFHKPSLGSKVKTWSRQAITECCQLHLHWAAYPECGRN